MNSIKNAVKSMNNNKNMLNSKITGKNNQCQMHTKVVFCIGLESQFFLLFILFLLLFISPIVLLALFMGPIVLLQLFFYFIYSTFNKKFSHLKKLFPMDPKKRKKRKFLVTGIKFCVHFILLF